MMQALDLSSTSRALQVLAGLAALLLLATSTSACSCIQAKPPLQELQNSDVVFSGSVLRIRGKSGGREVWFSVDRTWKGAEKGWARVSTGFGGGDCGYPFQKGSTYLVYAYAGTDPEDLHTSICERTVALAGAGRDLAALGPGHAPKTPEPVPLPLDLPPPAAWLVLAGLMLMGLGIAVHLIRRSKGRPALG